MCRKTRLFPANVEDAESVMPDEVKHLIPITRSIAKGLGVCSKTHGMSNVAAGFSLRSRAGQTYDDRYWQNASTTQTHPLSALPAVRPREAPMYHCKVNPRTKLDTYETARLLGVRALCPFNPYRERLLHSK